MIPHKLLDRKELIQKIRLREILFAGNLRLKIYGLLNCSSGKRMKTENRVFFVNEQEAIDMGFRPCGNCMSDRYREWKLNR
jgi:methylphosphotriester-DNA--protein-cysteine methyltransferase